MGVESKKLFEVPIGTNGKVVCTQPADKVYVLEFTSPPDNRLTSVSEFFHRSLLRCPCRFVVMISLVVTTSQKNY